MADLKIWCLVNGTKSKNAFSVKISSDDTVDDLKKDLKKALKAENTETFKGVDAKDLTLWCASISWDSPDPIKLAVPPEKDTLSIPRAQLKTVYPQGQGYNDCIIVQPPPSDKKRKASEEHRESSKYRRTFSPANEAYPGLHYYVESPLAKTLSERLLDSKFCLVYGHRQSGKSTVMYAAQRHLRDLEVKIPGFNKDEPTALDVYVISFNSGIDVDHGIDAFWKCVCRKLRVSNPTLFNFDESTVSSATFEGFFRKQDSSRPIVLLFDEVSWLVGKDAAVVDSFLGMLRLLKANRNECCLHATALVGVHTIKRFLKSPTSISPFTHEATITPERFEASNIEDLLRQYSDEERVELDAAAIGQDIFERTLGHKGLVGICCQALSEKVVNNRNRVSLEEWQKYASVGLLGFTRERATYARVISSLPNLSPTQLQTVGVVLRNGSTIVQASNELEELLAEGTLMERPTETENETRTEIHVECAAPILRNLMIYHVSGPTPKVSAPPLTRDELDVEWLLAQTVENLAPQHVFTRQTFNSSGTPSEYAFQFEFTSIMKHLLSTTYPGFLYCVLPEAKERDEMGERRRRLDILVCDRGRRQYGFELLVQGTNSDIDDHLNRSDYYRRLHSCHAVYMINLTSEIANADYYGSTYQGVVPLHVVYNREQGTALIKYRDRQEQVSFCAPSWDVMFSSSTS